MLLPLVIPTASSPTATPTIVPVLAGGDAFRLLLDGMADDLTESDLAATDQIILEGDTLAPQIPDIAPVAPPAGEDLADVTGEDLNDEMPLLSAIFPEDNMAPGVDLPAAVVLAEEGRKAPGVLPVGVETRVPPTLAQRLVVRMMAEQAPAVPPPPGEAAALTMPVRVVPPQKGMIPDEGIAGRTLPVAEKMQVETVEITKSVAPVARAIDPVIAPAQVAASPLQATTAPDAPARAIKTGIVLRDFMAGTTMPTEGTASLPFGADVSDSPFGAAIERAVQGTGAKPADQPQQGLARHVAQQIAVSVTQVPGQPTEIALNPEELGRVRMSMASTDGTLMVHILAERPETADLLRRHIDALAQEFRNLGYSDVSFDFGGDRAPQRQDRDTGPATPTPDGLADGAEATPVHATRVTIGLDLRL